MSSPRRLSVLLAEDTLANQRVIGALLEKRGHRVTITANGREAVAAFEKSKFDVILMDLQMPELDGYGAVAAIRALEQASGAHTPIIALSAHSTDRDRRACLDATMDAYLAKPIDVEALVAAIESSGTRLRPSPADRAAGNGGLVEEPELVVLDLQSTIRRLGGSEELLKEFIDVFKEESPGLLGELRAAIAAGDFSAAARAAHSLRGLAANFDATSVTEPASWLEKAAQKHDLAEADALLERLSSAVLRLGTALESHRRS
jgi:CheY-like chemotaxis protein